ncbi:unnamed protein product [Chironomus riparius]|nr:unnamed protein product [Chironomus riparius]
MFGCFICSSVCLTLAAVFILKFMQYFILFVSLKFLLLFERHILEAYQVCNSIVAYCCKIKNTCIG